MQVGLDNRSEKRSRERTKECENRRGENRERTAKNERTSDRAPSLSGALEFIPRFEGLRNGRRRRRGRDLKGQGLRAGAHGACSAYHQRRFLNGLVRIHQNPTEASKRTAKLCAVALVALVGRLLNQRESIWRLHQGLEGPKQLIRFLTEVLTDNPCGPTSLGLPYGQGPYAAPSLRLSLSASGFTSTTVAGSIPSAAKSCGALSSPSESATWSEACSKACLTECPNPSEL